MLLVAYQVLTTPHHAYRKAFRYVYAKGKLYIDRCNLRTPVNYLYCLVLFVQARGDGVWWGEEGEQDGAGGTYCRRSWSGGGVGGR